MVDKGKSALMCLEGYMVEQLIFEGVDNKRLGKGMAYLG